MRGDQARSELLTGLNSAQAAAATAAPTITEAVAYLDSLTIYCWRPLPPGVLTSLRKQYGRRLIIESIKTRSRIRGKFKAGRSIRFTRVTIHQPHVATLKHLQDLQHGRFAISEVHIAVDFLCATSGEAESLYGFLQASVVQRWRRKGQNSYVKLSTTYGNRDKRAPRNSAVYAARPSKTNSRPCCHLELRFAGAQACKRAGKRVGLNNFASFIGGLEALALLEHETRLVSIDQHALNRIVDRFVRCSKRRHPNKSLADIKTRVVRLLARRLADEDSRLSEHSLSDARAQALYDLGPVWRTCLRDRTAWRVFTPPPRWHHWL